MNQFREYAKIYFNFLYEYGYAITEESNDNIVSFIGKSNRIEIIFSSYCHELSCQFSDNDNKSFSLQDGLEYISVQGVSGLYQMENEGGVERGLHYLAEAVKLLFVKIDISDSINFQKVYQFNLNMQKTLLEKYYLETDLKKAEDYWKKKKYVNAKALFEKNIDHLSNAQLKKLEYIKNNI